MSSRALPPLFPTDPLPAKPPARQENGKGIGASLGRLVDSAHSAVDAAQAVAEEYFGATTRALDILLPLPPESQATLQRLASSNPASPSCCLSQHLPISARSVSEHSLAPDDASFFTALEGEDHRVGLKVLVLAILVRLGGVVDGTVGWEKVEPWVPRLRLLASNPLLAYLIPPLIRNALLDELTRWHRELALRKIGRAETDLPKSTAMVTANLPRR